MIQENNEPTPANLLEAINDLRKEVKNLRADMNRVEETVIRERIRGIEDVLSKNHLSVYADQRTEGLNQELALLVKADCQNKNKCAEHFKEQFAENIKVINRSGSKTAICDLDKKIADTQSMIEKTKGNTCEKCFSNFQKTLKSEKRAYQEIVLVKDLETDEKSENQPLNVGFLLQNLFEPLGNDSRLRILACVYGGKKSFSELSKTVELKAGHLAFHLRKLVNSNLIAQEASKGDYVITQKGLALAKELMMLQK
jgi:predicted transcriptional regulator